MVDWVKAIASRACAQKAGALVIPQNGSQLLAQPDFADVISAIGIEDLFTEGNKRKPKAHTAEVLNDLKRMAAAHKPAWLIEYPKNAERQALVKTQARENGLVWLITDCQLQTLVVSGN